MPAEGAIYFPTIRVPNSTWTNHVLLYWERAATIVPRQYLGEPMQHDPYTLELVRRELLQQVDPMAAEHSVCQDYIHSLESLDAKELRQRQRAFRSGYSTPIHRDKLAMVSGMDRLIDVGLASRPQDRPFVWMLVEQQTAREYMASLAIACAHPRSELSRETTDVRWFPASDTITDLSPFYGGRYAAASSLMELLAGDDEAQFDLRIRKQDAERAAAELFVLKQVLPSPEQPLSPEAVESFRRRHGAMLPAFRRHVQQRLDEALRKAPEEAFVSLNSLVEECSTLRRDAEAYLGEAGYHLLSDSVLVSLIRHVPFAAKPMDAAVNAAKGMKTVNRTEFAAQPLAYAAVAQAALGERVRRSVEVHFTYPEPVFVPRY